MPPGEAGGDENVPGGVSGTGAEAGGAPNDAKGRVGKLPPDEEKTGAAAGVWTIWLGGVDAAGDADGILRSKLFSAEACTGIDRNGAGSGTNALSRSAFDRGVQPGLLRGAVSNDPDAQGFDVGGVAGGGAGAPAAAVASVCLGVL